MNQWLKKLDAWLKKQAPDWYARLEPGMSNEELAALEGQCGPLPAAFRDYLAWKRWPSQVNLDISVDEDAGLPGTGTVLGSTGLEQVRDDLEDEGYETFRGIPFLCQAIGDAFYVDMDGLRTGRKGQVLEVGAEGEHPALCFPSFEDWLRWLALALERGGRVDIIHNGPNYWYVKVFLSPDSVKLYEELFGDLSEKEGWDEKAPDPPAAPRSDSSRSRYREDLLKMALERGLHWACQLDPPLNGEALGGALARGYYIAPGVPGLVLQFGLQAEEEWEVYLSAHVEERGLVVESVFSIPMRASERLRLAANCVEYGNPLQASAELSAAAFFCYQSQRMVEALRLATKALELNADNSVARQSLCALEAKGVPAQPVPMLQAIWGL